MEVRSKCSSIIETIHGAFSFLMYHKLCNIWKCCIIYGEDVTHCCISVRTLCYSTDMSRMHVCNMPYPSAVNVISLYPDVNFVCQCVFMLRIHRSHLEQRCYSRSGLESGSLAESMRKSVSGRTILTSTLNSFNYTAKCLLLLQNIFFMFPYYRWFWCLLLLLITIW